MRVGEIADEFRALEERTADGLRVEAVERAPSPTAAQPAASRAIAAHRASEHSSQPTDPVEETPGAVPGNGNGSTAEFETLQRSFDRKADRIVKRLQAIEQRTARVYRLTPPRSGNGRPRQPIS